MHLFKMTAEKRDFLMTMEQWQVMRKNGEGEREAEASELKVEEIDDEEKVKFKIMETRQDFNKEEGSLEDEEQKECSIF